MSAPGHIGVTDMAGAATGSTMMAEADIVAACDPTTPDTEAGPITGAAGNITAAADLMVHRTVERDLAATLTTSDDPEVHRMEGASPAVATVLAEATTRTNRSC